MVLATFPNSGVLRDQWVGDLSGSLYLPQNTFGGILTSPAVRLCKQMQTLPNPSSRSPYVLATTTLLARSAPKGSAMTFTLLVCLTILFVPFTFWASNGPRTISCVATMGLSTEIRSTGGLLACLCTDFPVILVLRNAFLQVWPTWVRLFGSMCCTIFPRTLVSNFIDIL